MRTLTLRAALLVTTYAVTLGAADAAGQAVDLATHQLALTLWTFLAFALDALAIAAQAITGRYLGAGDVAGTRAVTRRMVQWGVVSGVVTGLLLALASPWLGALFTPDAAVRDLLVPVLLVAALGQPVAGVVFVLDGVLIGAGDGPYLARGGRGHAARVRAAGPGRRLALRRAGRGVGAVHRGVHGRPARRAGAPGPRRRLAGHRHPRRPRRAGPRLTPPPRMTA